MDLYPVSDNDGAPQAFTFTWRELDRIKKGDTGEALSDIGFTAGFREGLKQPEGGSTAFNENDVRAAVENPDAVTTNNGEVLGGANSRLRQSLGDRVMQGYYVAGKLRELRDAEATLTDSQKSAFQRLKMEVEA